MEKKGILKMRANNEDRIMHYSSENNKVLILSLNDTKLIHDIKENPNITISFDIKTETNIPAVVEINEDKEKIIALFNKMLEEKHTYFKEYDNRLIILEVMLK